MVSPQGQGEAVGGQGEAAGGHGEAVEGHGSPITSCGKRRTRNHREGTAREAWDGAMRVCSRCVHQLQPGLAQLEVIRAIMLKGRPYLPRGQ